VIDHAGTNLYLRLLNELESETVDMSESGYQPTNYCWRPGEALPRHQEGEELPNSNYTSEFGENFSGFRDLFQRMESKIDAAFSEFDRKLESIEARVAVIEQRPLAPESPSTSSSSSSDDRKRKRRTPPELQVTEYSCILKLLIINIFLLSQ
jgi:hypothetical protein